jgi:hypothetical protein
MNSNALRARRCQLVALNILVRIKCKIWAMGMSTFMRRLEHEEQAAGGRPRKTIISRKFSWRVAGGEYYPFCPLSQRMAAINILRSIDSLEGLHHFASSSRNSKACWGLAMLI